MNGLGKLVDGAVQWDTAGLSERENQFVRAFAALALAITANKGAGRPMVRDEIAAGAVATMNEIFPELHFRRLTTPSTRPAAP